MSDENATSTGSTASEAPEASAPAAAERTYTQAEVDAIRQQTKDATYADARRTFTKPKRDGSSKQTKASDEQGADYDRLARHLAQRDALEEVLDGKSVTAAQRRQLREVLQRVDPDEPTAWLEQFVGTFVASNAAEQKTETAPPTQTKEPPVQRQPGDHPGAPQGAPPWERPTDPFKWSAEDVAQLQALKGAREANRIIRRKAEEYLRGVRLHVAPQQRR